MADWNWANGRLTRVVHPVGKFSNGEQRYRRAQFDYLRWDISGTEESYVLVPPADRQDGSQDSVANAVQQHETGALFGFYDGDTKVVNAEPEFGTDSVAGLHAFGYF